jgi:hypothetical protein
VNLDDLDEGSASFARAVFSKWPGWRSFAVVDGEGDAARFRLQLPDPPGSRLASPLSVWADGEEVTVGMDSWHGHFPWPREPDELAAEGADPIEFLQLLVEEKRAVLTYVRGDVFGASSILTLEDNRIGQFRERPSARVDSYRVRSWRGTLDADGGY